MTAPLVALPGLLILATGILAWWQRRRTIERNLRSIERTEWIRPPRKQVGWLIDVNVRPMGVGRDID